MDPRNPSGEIVLVRPPQARGPGSHVGVPGGGGPAGNAALCVVLPVITVTAVHGMSLGLGRVKYVQSSASAKTRIIDADQAYDGQAHLILDMQEEGRFVGTDTYSIIDASGIGRGTGSLLVRFSFEVIRCRGYSDAYQRLAGIGETSRMYALRALHTGSGAVHVPREDPMALYVTGSTRATVAIGRWVRPPTGDTTPPSRSISALPPGTVPVGTTLTNSDGAVVASSASACTMSGATGAITDFPGLRVCVVAWPGGPRARLFSNTGTFCLPNGTDVLRGASEDIYSQIVIGDAPYPRVDAPRSLLGLIGEGARAVFDSVADGDMAPGGYLLVRRPCVVRVLLPNSAYRVTFPPPR